MKRTFYLPGLLFTCLLLCNVAARANTPVITTNPHNITVCSGVLAWFNVIATDTPGTRVMHYQWQVSTDGGATWSAVSSGATYSIIQDTLKVLASTSLAGYKYRGVVIDSITSGSDTSTAAMLGVDTANAGSISGASSVCVGVTIPFSDAVTGGVWSSNNAHATVTGTGMVTGITAGTDSILYTITNTCGSTAAISPLTVNPVPAAGVVTGPNTVCQGSAITLTDTVTGGVWSSSSPSIATVDPTGIVTAVGQGFDTVVYTTTNGLCNSIAWEVVRVDTFVTALPITGPTVTCAGYSVDLMNANVLGTWTWSASNASATVNPSGSVMGAAEGLDTITYAFTNACNSVTSTDTVHVDTMLSHGVISGPSAVCAGSDISLSETVPGGTWFSSSSSIAVVSGAGTVTGVAQGLAVISYFLTNGCGASIATHTVNVFATAAAITGVDSVGTGNTLTLHDATTGGTWSSSNLGIATVGSATGIVTGVFTGIATITYTVTNLCGTSYATMTINVGHLPSITGTITGVDSVCVGSTITLADTVVGTGGGVWSSSRDTIATVNNAGVVTGVAKGLVTISYTVHNAFGSTRATKTIYVNAIPVVTVTGPNIPALGGDYFLIGTPDGGVWTTSNIKLGEFISVTDVTDSTGYVSSGSYVVTSGGIDTLYYTVTNTCGSASAYFIINVPIKNTGVNVFTNSASVLNVYPNPNEGAFTVNLSSDVNEPVHVAITNISGQLVKELTLTTNQSFDIKLNEPAGIYFLSAVTATGKYSARITIAK